MGGEPSLTNYTPACKQQRQPAKPAPTPDADPAFLRFWTAYPKKRGKQDAYRAGLPCDQTRQLPTGSSVQVELAAATHEWNREDGRFIPLPAKLPQQPALRRRTLPVSLPHKPQNGAAVIEKLIVAPDDPVRTVQLLYRDGLPSGDPTGWPSLNQFYTVASRQMTLVTGIPAWASPNG